MNTFTEILPERKSSRRSCLKWQPTAGDTQVAGVLTIHTDRASVAYTVSEFTTGWTGRGFVFAKLTPGTDTTEASYSVFCQPRRPAATSCDCKGHSRFLTCKHADAANALVANGWL
jgi:hypothetical protein